MLVVFLADMPTNHTWNLRFFRLFLLPLKLSVSAMCSLQLSLLFSCFLPAFLIFINKKGFDPFRYLSEFKLKNKRALMNQVKIADFGLIS